MPLRDAYWLTSAARRCVAAIIAVALAAAPAVAEPQWATDLRAKAEAWKRDLRDALDRIKAAADQARRRLAADANLRLDQLLAILDARASAIEALLREQGAEFEALAAARARQALAFAQQLERELAEVAAGARREISVDAARLATGSRAAVEDALRDAGAKLRDVRLIDGRLVAEVVTQTEASAQRWGWALIGVGGVAVLSVGLGMIWPRRRKQDGPVRRWLVTTGGLVVVVGGGAMAWHGVSRLLSHGRDAPVVLAFARCEALDRAPPGADPAAQARMVRDLARCQLAAPDDMTAAVITAALTRALARPSSGGSP